MQGGGRGGPVFGLPGATVRADAAPVRPLVLHGVRGGAAVEGRVGDVPSLPCAAAAGSGEAVRAGVSDVGEDQLRRRPQQCGFMASAVGVASGGDGQRNRDVSGGDGSGERVWHSMLSTNVEDVYLLRLLRQSMLLQYLIHCFARTRSQRHLPFPQGHIKAAGFIGAIYYWGHGVAIDY